MNVENCIEAQYRELMECSEPNAEYADLYKAFTHPHLREILTTLHVLLYIISLLSAIGTLDVIEAHFGVPFKYSFIIVVTLFILGLFWGIIEYRNHRKL